jgi:hypothetical protein
MKVFFAVILILSLSGSVFCQRAECFPFEKLSTEKRQKAENLLLKALDSESLFTIVGGLKPMSSGFAAFSFSASQIRNISETEAIRILNKFPDEVSRKKADNEEKIQIRQAESFFKRRQTLSEIDETKEILRFFRCGNNFFADVQHFAKQ